MQEHRRSWLSRWSNTCTLCKNWWPCPAYLDTLVSRDLRAEAEIIRRQREQLRAALGYVEPYNGGEYRRGDHG